MITTIHYTRTKQGGLVLSTEFINHAVKMIALIMIEHVSAASLYIEVTKTREDTYTVRDPNNKGVIYLFDVKEAFMEMTKVVLRSERIFEYATEGELPERLMNDPDQSNFFGSW